MKKQLLEQLLLGSERSTIDTTLLSKPVQDIFPATSISDSAKLLTAITLEQFYQTTGQSTTAYTADIDASVIQEEQREAPQELQHLFTAIYSLDATQSIALLTNLLSVFEDNKWRVTPMEIVKLLQFTLNATAEIRQLVTKVIGQKGQQILPLVKGYVQSNEATNWDVADIKTRKKIITELLDTAPEIALGLIQKTWNEEAVNTKKAFLSLLTNNTNSDFKAFVADKYNTEFAHKEKERKTNIDCREISANYLISKLKSELHKVTLQLLTPAFSMKQKGGMMNMIKKVKTAKLDLSAATFLTDDTVMLSQYGKTKGFDISRFDTQAEAWFSELLLYLPLEAIAKTIDCNVTAIADAILSDEHYIKIDGKLRPKYLVAIQENLFRFPNETLADHMVLARKYHLTPPVLQHMKAATYEAYMDKHNYYADIELLKQHPNTRKGQFWPLKYSQKVLQGILNHMLQSQRNMPYGIGKAIANYIHPAIVKQLDGYYNQAERAAIGYQWEKFVHGPLVTTTHINYTILQHTSPQ